MPGAVRFTLAPSTEPALEETLAELFVSWSVRGGALSVWVPEGDADEVSARLEAAGLEILGREMEPERDWVAEAAALQRPVAVGGLVLDPHEPPSADLGGRYRLLLPAERAFGTGSHESTRLALRLLLSSVPAGGSVLDVGCGAGTLALAARTAGAGRAFGFDLDLEAPLASRVNARRNGIDGCAFWGGLLESLLPAARFDLVVANMLHEEVGPLLPGLAALIPPGGLLVTAGQLVAREAEFLRLLEGAGLVPRSLASEGEWLGTLSVRP
jgi:ribosomal protein L11 methyltransferase